MSKLVEGLEVEGKLNVLFTVAEANGMDLDELIATIVNAETVVFKSGEDEVELTCCQNVIEQMIEIDENGDAKIVISKKVCEESLKTL